MCFQLVAKAALKRQKFHVNVNVAHQVLYCTEWTKACSMVDVVPETLGTVRGTGDCR